MQIAALDSLPAIPWKYKLAYLVYQFSQMEQAETPVKHSFVGNEYHREMTIPAGTLFIGRSHTNGHVVQLVKGSVVNITEDSRDEIEAPFEFKSHPGYQAVFYALTDVVGVTVHENPLGIRDVQILEDRDFDPVEHLISRGRMVAEKVEACLE
jgi:hypothetical protein